MQISINYNYIITIKGNKNKVSLYLSIFLSCHPHTLQFILTVACLQLHVFLVIALAIFPACITFRLLLISFDKQSRIANSEEQTDKVFICGTIIHIVQLSKQKSIHNSN